MEQKKLIALSTNGKQIAIVKNVSEKEYKTLLNEENEYNAKQEHEYKSSLESLYCYADTKSKEKDFILAKCIYDNFVDRGLIDNSDTFQQEWYDYFFNDKELDLEQAPQEYKKILDKVGNFNEKESD